MPKNTIYLKDYKPHPFTIKHVDLCVDIFDGKTIVESVMQVEKRGAQDSLVLDGESLTLLDVEVDGRQVTDYVCDDKTLTIPIQSDKASIKIRVEIDPAKNHSGNGFYQSGDIFCTQCEAQGFRKITYFIDRPDNMATFTCKLSADKKKFPILLANGNKTGSGDLEDGRHFVSWSDPFKKPCYLFAMVAGDLGLITDTFTTRSGREVALEIFVDHGNESKATYAMESLKRSMKWDEDRFDLEYDLDIYMIVAVDSFNMGAMENKGLNIFNSSCTLADQETAEDHNFQRVEGVIGHEYFHNWTGNRVTCRDWFQLTLKEGLTVFRDQEFSSDLNSRAVKRIEEVQTLRSRQFPEDASPMSHPIRPLSYQEINNFYTATVYEKGSEVIRMIHTIIGEEAFQKGMKVYFQRHDGQAVTTEDFIAAMEEGSGENLAQFRHWYSQSGTPKVTVEESYDDQAKRYEIHLSQALPKAAATANNDVILDIPLKLALFSQSGEVLAPESLIRLDQEKASYTFENVAEKPVLSFNRDFTAPVLLQHEQSTDELITLLQFDDDAFNKFDAAYRLHTQAVMHIRENQPYPSQLIDVFGSLLGDQSLDPALVAMMMKIPSEANLNQMLDTYDIEGIHQAREIYKKEIAVGLYKEWLHTYESNKQSEYVVNAQGIGKRSLKNAALSYLVASGKEEAVELAYAQYNDSDNMTDRLCAYYNLFIEETKYANEVNQSFHQRFKNESLVMNKWFSIQTQQSHKGLVEKVSPLVDLDEFDAKNPNKLRSLYGSLTHNLMFFHQKDGSGYTFIADKISEIDTFNPQIASGLAKTFGASVKLNAEKRKLAKSALENILSRDGVSPDVQEVVSSYVQAL